MGLRVGEVVQVPPLLKNREARKVCHIKPCKWLVITGSRNGLPMPYIYIFFFHFTKTHTRTLVKSLRFTCVISAVHVSGG
jgi:hypothetical protein